MIERLRAFLRRKFVQDTLALQAGKIISAGIGLTSSVVIARLLGPEVFGTWALVASFFAISQTFNLTGIGVSTGTRLALAIGARDESEILNLMGFYVRVVLLWATLSTAALALLGPPLARALYAGEARIGALAALLSLTVATEGLYELVMIAFRSRRSMRSAALLQTINLFVLAAASIVAVLISRTVEALVAARLVYSSLTLLLAWGLYLRLRSDGPLPYPLPGAILARARTVAGRPYWRFGVAIALDKNVALLYTQLPVQLVGIMAGKQAAGFLQLALSALAQASILTSAVFDNMQAVVPQAVGRGNFAALRRDFTRVLLFLGAGALAFYALWALLAPALVPLIYGEDWRPAIPLIVILSGYGAVTAVGGVFGPLYRALDIMRAALTVKLVALVLLLPGSLFIARSGASGGAWAINGLLALSVALTALVTLPALKARAAHIESGSQNETGLPQDTL